MTIYKYEMSVRNCGMSRDRWLCTVCDSRSMLSCKVTFMCTHRVRVVDIVEDVLFFWTLNPLELPQGAVLLLRSQFQAVVVLRHFTGLLGG